jgi:hypothetical protein
VTRIHGVLQHVDSWASSLWWCWSRVIIVVEVVVVVVVLVPKVAVILVEQLITERSKVLMELFVQTGGEQ